MIGSVLKTSAGKLLATARSWAQFSPPTVDQDILLTESFATAHSVFAVAQRLSQGTVEVIPEQGGGSFVILDVLISGDKVNGATITLSMDDDTNQEALLTVTTTDAPVALSWPVRGRVQSWEGARLDLTTVNSVEAYVTVVYMKLPQSDPYSTWASYR